MKRKGLLLSVLTSSIMRIKQKKGTLGTMNQRLFQETCNQIVGQEESRSGIGTLKEKTLHKVLKYYYEPDVSYHEKRKHGFVADILRENEVIEIQTRSFDKLRRKLDVFLEGGPVTIVYPVPHTKWIQWIDEETGEVTKRRKSPKQGSPYEIVAELYKIKCYLNNENLRFIIPLIDMEESRLLNGWSLDRKKGSTRQERIPLELKEEVRIECRRDFCKLIPDGLQKVFTAKDYEKAAKVSIQKARTALNVLAYVEVVEKVGKRGNTILYGRKEK